LTLSGEISSESSVRRRFPGDRFGIESWNANGA
jgi:hypothetical protein